MNPIDNSVFDIMARATPTFNSSKIKSPMVNWLAINNDRDALLEELKASLKSLAHILLYE